MNPGNGLQPRDQSVPFNKIQFSVNSDR